MIKRNLGNLLHFLAAPLLVSFYIVFYYRIWAIDLNLPVLFGGGDGLFPLLLLKNMVTGTSHQVSSFVGAPFEFNFYDFPVSGEAVQFLGFKILSFFSDSVFWIHNTYYFLKFPITAMVAYLVLCDLKIRKVIAIFAAVIFSLAPLVFMRGIGHYFLGVIYSVPIGVWLCFLIYENRIPKFSLFSGEVGKTLNYRLIVFLGGIAVLAGAGVYYSFYACLFMFLSYVLMLANSDKIRKLENLKPLVPMILVIIITVLYSLPNLIYYSEFGRNPLIGQRSTVESDIFGLKIMALFMPVGNHYISQFAEIARSYSLWPLYNENVFAALGLFGAFGLFLSVIWGFLESSVYAIKGAPSKLGVFLGIDPDDLKRISLSSKLAIFSLLYASIGGFAFFVAVWFPSIRAQNRISAYIMFFSVFFLASITSIFFKRKIESSRIKTAGFVFFLLVITFSAALDQSGRRPAWQSPATLAAVETTKKFVERIEENIQIGDKIMQLPIGNFPEAAPVVKMMHYEHLTAYMFSKKAHWSYGAMTGRPAYEWQSSIADLEPEAFVQQILNRGFKGIYIDRFGYLDNAVSLEAKFAKLLKSSPIESDDHRFIYFKLPEAAFEILYNEHARPEKMIIYDSSKIQYSTIESHLFIDKLKQFVDSQQEKQMIIEFSNHSDLVDWKAYDAIENDTLDLPVANALFEGGLSCPRNSELNVRNIPAPEPIRLKFFVENESSFWWHINGPGKLPLHVRTILYNTKMEIVPGSQPFIFYGLAHVGPQTKKELNFVLVNDTFKKAMPAGDSILEIGLLQEGYAFAKDINPKVKRCLIRVKN